MKQSIYLVILFVTLSNLQLSYCQSERWVYLGNTDGVEIYIDKNTIKYDNIFHNYKIFTKAVNFDKTFQISLSY
ncbi:MAG: hypothetical protein NTU73_05825, partial [Ignavibacteriae bacterium]|nr:hypothetical protein [Ignavibacteriota bacterium]